MGVHVPEQAEGAPVETGGRLILKFTNFWTLETEPGWSLLFLHPLNRPDLPFRTLSGLVDTDRFGDGYANFPAVPDPGCQGTIPRGTRVAQAIPVKRQAVLTREAMDPGRIARNRAVQESLQGGAGGYRKTFRR